ncbi:MAG: AMP-binding protein, partial [Candidatus Dormibacteraeota bacterium]|nr:AMP-binding protein [Candidatus Dormibacteraeota bacterium]
MHASIAERRAALEAGLPAWPSLTYPTLLRRNVERFGDRPAVLTDRRSLTYREVWEESRALAKGLVAIGVQPGDHVAMVMANHAEFVVLQFAVACAGAVNVPFNFRLQREELSYVIGQSDATCLVTMDAFGDHDYLALLDGIAPGWERTPQATFPKLRQVITFSPGDSRPPRPGVLDLAGLAERGRAVADAEIDRRIEAARASDVVCVMYTSGTTGFSKGAMLTHDNFLRCAWSSARIRALEDGRRILFSLPLYHV